MSADMDLYPNGPPIVSTYVPHSRDLETIVTLLEIAAIDLTPAPGAEFAFEDLIQKANELGGGEVVLDPVDVEIVKPHLGFLLERRAGNRYRLR
jgi:hypothetical protein